MFRRILAPNLKGLAKGYNVKYQLSEIVRPNQKCFSDIINKKVDGNFLFQTTNSHSEEYRKKEPIVPKITLVSGNDLEITTLEAAQKLAKRRDLKLVKIVDVDTKTHRPLYKLMSGAEYHEEDLKQRERKKSEKQKGSFKGEKVLIVRQNISQHDLQIHCSKIIKWLDKKYEVKVVINGDIENIKKGESVYALLEKNLIDNGRIVQKRQKGSDIKFQVLPSKENKNDDNKIKDTSANCI